MRAAGISKRSSLEGVGLADYYDISPVLKPSLAVFPGDQPFSRKIAMRFEDGHNLALSSITTTLHIGAHADAPCHYHPSGVSIEKRDLGLYIGPCNVIRVQAARGARIGLKHLDSSNDLRFYSARVVCDRFF